MDSQIPASPTPQKKMSLVDSGNELVRQLTSEVPAARRGVDQWNEPAVLEIRDKTIAYFRRVSQVARWYALAIFALLIVDVSILATTERTSPFHTYCLIVGVVVGFVAVFHFRPVVAILKLVRELPAVNYREILSVLWANLDLIAIGLNLVFFIYIYLSVQIRDVAPIVIIMGVIWLAAPTVLYLLYFDHVYIYIRIAQVAITMVFAFIVAISPVPLRHFQTWAQLRTAEKMRPMDQKEITNEWSTLQWFSQEGATKVWYSDNKKRGPYRLFAAPGYDPITNEQLKPVDDQLTREEITKWLSAQEAVKKNQELENKAAESAKIQAEKELAHSQELLAKQKKEAEAKERLITQYVYPRAISANRPHLIALLVMNEQSQPLSENTDAIATALRVGGINADAMVFTPSFISSQTMQSIRSGDFDTPFRPSDYAAKLLIVSVSSKTSKELPTKDVEMVGLETEYKIQIITLSEHLIVPVLTLQAKGIGFTESDARRNSQERINAELIASAPKLAQKLSEQK